MSRKSINAKPIIMLTQSKLNGIISQGKSLVPYVKGYYLLIGGEDSMDISIPIFDIDYTFKRGLIHILIEKSAEMVWIKVEIMDVYTGIENVLSAKIMRTNIEAIRVFSEN
jgi:hypothetical protein